MSTIHSILVSAMLATGLAGFSGKGHAEDVAATRQFMADRLAAFGSGNVEALLAQYRADAVVITPEGTLRGANQIRGMIEGVVGEFAVPGVKFELLHQAAEGPVANFVWKAETLKNVYDLGVETYLLEDGKVAFQTFAAKATAK